MNTGSQVGLAPSGTASGARPRVGNTRISPRALTGVVEAVTADVFSVPIQDLKARLRDDRGMLWVAVTVPMAVPPLRQAGRGSGVGAEGSLYDRAEENRRRIIERTRLLTGYEVGRVDLRLMGASPAREARVR